MVSEEVVFVEICIGHLIYRLLNLINDDYFSTSSSSFSSSSGSSSSSSSSSSSTMRRHLVDKWM